MRYFLLGLLSALLGAVLLGMIMWFIVVPRLDWGAAQQSSAIEKMLSSRAIARWVALNAPASANPIAPTAGNLKSGEDEYEEHCAVCHGVDGSGHDQFEADFLPRVPRLTAEAQELSDGKLYFIISSGIRNTAMPSFRTRHNPEEIWKTILWVRHLAHLTPEERRKIAREASDQKSGHEEIMKHGRTNNNSAATE